METVPPPPLQTPTPDTLLQLFNDMKTRLLSFEMLWTRVKQLEMRQENTETQLVRVNARVSAAIRRRYTETDVDGDESQNEELPGTTLEAAELISKRQHSDQRYSRQQQAPPTTTSPT